ncbi:hypothetical protein BRSU_2789 [Brachyspira suanatina]|uniref:Pentapeptide repeat-containing protein n=1 Tax=Brachyspira suanatina TaxID=381802 RepID=A0A0G4KB44_9SPIR|nr:pentapeptide repeat-containing protein [Brachyspira suanatina]CRF35643.1 hypothetical protein BRSU_2789 [Brachyspira suanatina]
MTNLNVNNLKKFKKQPTKYNTEKELIDWLKWDLFQQIEEINKTSEEQFNKIKDNLINIEKIQNILVLNIGKKELSNNNSLESIIINFEFNISSIFYELLNQYNNIIEIKINCTNLLFNHDAFFSICIFKQDVDFYLCKFNHNIYFLGTTFEKLVNFKSSIFYEKINFSELSFNYATFEFTTFYKEISFSELTFNNIYLKNIKYLLTKLYFNDIKFKDLNSKLYIDLSNKNINNINIKNTIINGEIELRNIEAEEVDFKGSIINGGLINPVNFKVHKFANRESALFLKQQAYAANNAIDALQYKAKEIECHKYDLMKSAKDIIQNKEYSFSKKIKELYKIVGDIASIYLSSLYSNNGQNWVKALFMTISITIICFIVFYIPDLTDSNIIRLYYRNLFPELIKYFIPTDYSLIIKYAASKLNLFLKIFGVLVYFLGKILFWYGSVQTVQAFRKFAKGA